MIGAEIENFPLTADAFAKQNVELGGLERRCNFVFYHLDLGFAADRVFAPLDRSDATDVEPHRGIKLQCVATGGGLGAAEHDADLHADLVDENHHAVAFLDVRGELAQRLAHQPRLQAGQRVAHLALEFGLGRERGHRVDHDQIDRSRAHQAVDDFQRLLTRVGLRNQQIVQAHTELLRVLDVQRMLGVDKGALTAEFLHFGDDLQGERGLARRLRAVNLDHPSTRQAADTERDVESERAGRDDLNVLDHLTLTEPHDGALAELLFDLRQRDLQGLGFFAVEGIGFDGVVHERAPSRWVRNGLQRLLPPAARWMFEPQCSFELK